MAGCTKFEINKPLEDLAPLCFTPNAAKKAAEIITEVNEENHSSLNLNLRLSIKSGGCAGLEYEFNLDDKIRADDHIEITNGIRLVVDANSFPFLSGATVDYVEDLEGQRFTIDNPNAEKTCGCGSSFDVKETV